MNRKFAVMILSAGFLAGNVMAGNMGSIKPASDPAWVATLSAGPVWEYGGKTQTFYLTPTIEKTYAANDLTKALANGEIFVGLQKNLSQTFQGQFGLALAATSSASLSGSIWDDADPQFNNYTYNYKIQHNHLAVKGKILSEKGWALTPWVSGSLGVGVNRAHGFTNTPTIFQAIANPDFASHNKASFTYTLGAGIQRVLSKNWLVGAGYEFADWGKSQLNRAPGQTLGSGLTLNHLYTNGVLFNLTYIA